jgi:hypothetical protein
MAHTQERLFMRHLSGCSIAFVLALLLVSTSPVGTGAGVHQFELLHPLFAHIHIVNGRVLTHEQLLSDQQPSPDPQPFAPGPAFGAGGGGTPADAGLGLGPTLPLIGLVVISALPDAWLSTDSEVPAGREEAPPDPPPLT